MAVSRTIIYHPLAFDFGNLWRCLRGLGRRPAGESRAVVRRFEERFAECVGTRHAVAFPFARTAVYFALQSQQFPPGSEVIMPPITIKPMMDVVLALGLKPVFADIEQKTLCFNPDELRRTITDRTKAILITYLFGLVPDIDRLASIWRDRGLFVIEDFSHCLNAKYDGAKLGTFGNVGVYSCSAFKTLDAYGGGLAVTNDEQLCAALREAQQKLKLTPTMRLVSKIQRDLIWNLATQKWIFTLTVFPMLRFFRKVNPVWEQKLTGARLGLLPAKELPEAMFEQFTWLQAETGLALIDGVEAQDAARIANVQDLRRELREFADCFPAELEHAENVYWQYLLYARHGEHVQAELGRRGIDTGTSNLSLISGLGIYREHERRCPTAESIKQNGMYIPVYSRLGSSDLERIKSALREVLEVRTKDLEIQPEQG
jgi:dTDP-4-amino-4,6-dideoxygalactose transaminase